MFRGFVILLFVLLAVKSRADVWVATESWSPAWEDRYSQWVKSDWNREIFARETLPNGQSNPYHGLKPDCADAVYSMRAIFAYENRLPFAVLDPTGGGRTIGHRMKRFDSLPDGRRFPAFLRSLYGTISTRSLSNDLYPIAVTPRTARSGAVMKTVQKNHHSWTVKDVLPVGVPWLIFASTVSSTTTLTLYQRQSWPNPAWMFEGDNGPSSGAGFHRFRPLEFLGRPAWTVPGYNEEQYKIPVNQWVRWAQSRLAVRKETDAQMLNRLAQAACEGLKDRVGAVNDALAYLREHPNQCMPSATYDVYSTPNRDQRFFDDLVALRIAARGVHAAGGASRLPAELLRRLDKIFPFIQGGAKEEAARMPASAVDADSMCPVTTSPGRTIDLAEAKRRLFAGLMSNNPHDDVEFRWGEKRGSSPLAARCPSWDHWSPDLNTAN